MNITTTTVTTRKTTVGMLRSEIENIILVHLRDKRSVSGDSPEFIWAGNGNGGVSIDFVEEDCTEEPLPSCRQQWPDNGVDWDALPPAAQWVAMDENREWYWYEDKPVMRTDAWDSNLSFDFIWRCQQPFIVNTGISIDWTQSLQQRPSASPEQPDNDEKEQPNDDVEKQPDDGWIAWTATEDSRDPPVDGRVRVNVLLSSGSVPGVGIAARAFRWYTVPGLPHIVSYKLLYS